MGGDKNLIKMATQPPAPLKVLDTSFLEGPANAAEKPNMEIVERNVAIISDSSELLYESMMEGIPEQIRRASAFFCIGVTITMPYPKKEVN